jgi:hypothetical protein
MLKESALVPNSDIGKNTGGFHLDPVGGRIVREVVIGLLQTVPAPTCCTACLGADPAEAGERLSDDRFSDVRGRRPGDTAGPEAYLRMTEASLAVTFPRRGDAEDSRATHAAVSTCGGVSCGSDRRI